MLLDECPVQIRAHAIRRSVQDDKLRATANFGCTHFLSLRTIGGSDHMGLRGMAMKAVSAALPDRVMLIASGNRRWRSGG